MGINTKHVTDATLGGQMLTVDDYTGNTIQYADSTSRGVMTKIGSLARTDTVAKNLFVLPIGAIPIAVYLFWTTASNAGTTATVSVGITGTNTYFVSAQDVKGTTGQVRPTAGTNLFVAQSTSANTQVVGIYAETGTASNAGGPFFVAIDFYLP